MKGFVASGAEVAEAGLHQTVLLPSSQHEDRDRTRRCPLRAVPASRSYGEPLTLQAVGGETIASRLGVPSNDLGSDNRGLGRRRGKQGRGSRQHSNCTGRDEAF